MRYFKRITALFIILMFGFMYIYAEDDGGRDAMERANSFWAGQAIANFLLNEVDVPNLMEEDYYRSAINREEFTELLVGLYAKSKGIDKEELEIGANPFVDTENEDVIRAYRLGIVKGTPGKIFRPKKKLSREEMAVMTHRFLKQSVVKIEEPPQTRLRLADCNDVEYISPWALESVEYFLKEGYLEGNYRSYNPDRASINPDGIATAEESLVMLDRIARRYGWLSPSKDIYLNGFYIPNDAGFRYGSTFYLYAFNIYFDYSKFDETWVEKNLRYMFEKKFPKDRGLTDEIVSSVIQDSRNISDFRANRLNKRFKLGEYTIYVKGSYAKGELSIRRSSEKE